MNEKRIKIKVLLFAVILFILVYLFFYYLFPLLFPFVLAYLLSVFIHAGVNLFLKFLNWKRSFLTGVFLILFFFLLGILSTLAIREGIRQLQFVLLRMDDYQRVWEEYLRKVSTFLEDSTGVSASYISDFINTSMMKINNKLQNNAFDGILNHSFRYIGNLANGIGCLFVILITAFFLAKDFDDIHWKIKDYFWYRDIHKIYKRVTDVAGVYLRAQIIIMTLVGIVVIICLFLLKQPYWLFLGILIGFLDALPFLGTGTVFVPWGIICLFRGDLFHAAAYLSIYILTAFLREYLEPKLIGNRLGISPIFIIASIYIGLQLYGIKGVFLGPLSFLIYAEIFKEVLERFSIDLKKIK